MPKSAIALVSIAFAVGVLAVEYVPFAVCAVLSAVALLAAVCLAREKPRVALVILAAAFLLGAARHSVSRGIAPNDISRLYHVTAYRGTVASDPEGDEDRVRFVFRVDGAQTRGNWRAATGEVMVSLYSREGEAMPQLEYGDRASIIGPVYQPRDPTNPGRFSYRDYLARQGIYACASVGKASLVTRLPARSGNPLVALALMARHHIAASIGKIHPREEASVIIGMVLGTYAYLPDETFRNFSRTGTLHLLAASGYNCYVLLFLTGPLLKLMRVFPKYRGIATIFLILAYLLAAGAKPSLVRAAVMSSLMLLARPLKRVPDPANLYFIAGLVMLAIDPRGLFDVGFQLSFLAVWALIYVSPIIGATSALAWAGLVEKDTAFTLKGRRGFLRKFVGGLGATAIATSAITIVTAPAVAYYFNYLSLTSLPANVIMGLGVPIVFAVGFLSMIGSWLGWLGAAVGLVGTETTRAMLGVVNGLGSMKYSSISVASPGPLAILGYYVILHAALSYWRSRDAS